MITGCKSAKEDRSESQELALQTMEQRYGEKFTYVTDASSSAPCYSVELCYPYHFYVTPKNEKSPLYNQNIYVIVNNKNDKKEVYENYVALKYQKGVEDVFRSMVQKYFKEFHLTYDAMDYGDDTNHFTKDTTLEEYLMDGEKRYMRVFLEVRESEFQKEVVSQLLNQMTSMMRESYIFLVVSKDEYFGTSTEEELTEQASRNDFSKITTYAKIENFEEPKIEIYNQYGKI